MLSPHCQFTCWDMEIVNLKHVLWPSNAHQLRSIKTQQALGDQERRLLMPWQNVPTSLNIFHARVLSSIWQSVKCKRDVATPPNERYSIWSGVANRIYPQYAHTQRTANGILYPPFILYHRIHTQVERKTKHKDAEGERNRE